MIRNSLFSILFLTTSFCNVYAQSEQSNELYSKGVELYKRGQYLEAIPVFEACSRLDKAEMDSLDGRRNSTDQWIASCYYKAGNVQAAKEKSFFAYELPPVDRRIVEQSDRLSVQVDEVFRQNRLEEALALSIQVSALEEQLLGGETYYSVNTKDNQAYFLAVLGRHEEAEQTITYMLSAVERLYGDSCRLKALYLDHAAQLYLMAGNLAAMDACYLSLFPFLSRIGEQNSDFAETLLGNVINVYAQTGLVERVDWISDMLMALVAEKYGEKSQERCFQLNSIAQLNKKLGRLDLALKQNNEAVSLAKDTDVSEREEAVLIVTASRALTLMDMHRFKESRADLRNCLKGAKKLGKEEVSSLILSSLMMLQTAMGKKMDEDMLSEVVSLLASMENKETDIVSCSSVAGMIAMILAINGRTHEASSIAEKYLPVYEQLNLYSPLLSSCLVFLMDRQFVNARRASSLGLEFLNKDLLQDYAQMTVTESRRSIDNGLKMVDLMETQEGHFTADTIAYSLSMIKQDLLQARLQILYHTDSLGTEDFMLSLAEFARTAICDTKDEVMADSILNFYSTKLAAAFGDNSEQCSMVGEIREHCFFEKTSEGRLLAFKLTLYDEDSETYAQLLDEYNTSFERWRANKDVDPNAGCLKSDDYKIYEPPYLWSLNRENLRETADSCFLALQYMEQLLPTAVFAEGHSPFSYIRDLLTTWCFCADTLGHRAEVMPMLRKWHKLLTENKLSSMNQKLETLSWAWMYGEPADYEQLEEEFSSQISDDRHALHAAVMFEVIGQSRYKLGNDFVKQTGSRAVRELDETIRELSVSEVTPDLLPQKMFILRTMRLWDNYWKYEGIRSRKDLLPDFKRIYSLLEQYPALQAYRDSYDAMNMLCEITTDYNSRDDAMTVRADRMRRNIRRACLRAMQEQDALLSLGLWPTFSPIGKDFSLYASVGYLNQKMNELEESIRYAYLHEKADPNGSSSEQYENLKAMWDEIRMKQKSVFSDSKTFPDAIENLTTQVCSCLSDRNVSDTIRCLAYDIALFGKGYLLRSEQQQRKVILQSGNRSVLRQYDEYLRILQDLGNSALPDDEIRSLTSRAESIWANLRYESKSFDDYTKSMESSWKAVRDALADDEVAVEYLRSDDILHKYFALILRKGYEAPLVTEVGDESFFTYDPGTIYTRRYLSPWPSGIMLADSSWVYPFDGVRKIYVSPTGVLHQISMEAIHELYSDSIMGDKYQIYRVSSTRELTEKRSPEVQYKAKLFGGINYQLSDDEWEMMAQSKSSDTPLLAMRDVPLLSRGAVQSALNPLSGTVREVREISELFSHSSHSAECVMGNQATEENMKALSGSDVNVLHVATHGFYQPEAETADTSVVSFSRKDRSTSDNALSRSGLFLAGASALFDDTPIPDNVDDGILTALEISHLDMTEMNLVTLSACETGLGDITGDGVFGLQRGFKKAGAQSILMSLWKVDDEATCLLMTEFYKNWIAEKMTKHDALEAAKRTVRSHTEKGWDDPKHWAAFILLDGLD